MPHPTTLESTFSTWQALMSLASFMQYQEVLANTTFNANNKKNTCIPYSQLNGMLMVACPGLVPKASRRRDSRGCMKATRRPLLPTWCRDVAGIAPACRHKHNRQGTADNPTKRKAIVQSSVGFFCFSIGQIHTLLREKRGGVREVEEGRPTCREKNDSGIHTAQDRGRRCDERQRMKGWDWKLRCRLWWDHNSVSEPFQYCGGIVMEYESIAKASNGIQIYTSEWFQCKWSHQPSYHLSNSKIFTITKVLYSIRFSGKIL